MARGYQEHFDFQNISNYSDRLCILEVICPVCILEVGITVYIQEVNKNNLLLGGYHLCHLWSQH
jgi:hypothetical protein